MVLLLAQVLSYFMTSIVSTSLLIKPLRFWHRIILGAFLSILCLIWGESLGQLITPIFLTGSIFFISFKSSYRLLDTILFQIGWLWFVLTDYIVSIPMELLGFSPVELQTTGYLCLIYVITHSLISFLPAVIITPQFRKKYYPFLITIPHKAQRLLCIDLTICSGIYIFNIIYGSLYHYDNGTLFFNACLFFLYFFSNILLFYFLYRIMYENHKLNLEATEKKALEEYTINLEYLYQNIRSFKHDYRNMLSTLKFYIEEANIQTLKEYFYNKIVPLSNALDSQHNIMENLYHIKVLEVKGILYAKLTNAINLELNITFEVPDDITDTYIDSISLCKILGILIDNAIEAAITSSAQILTIALINTSGSLLIHIENSSPSINVPIEFLFNNNFTTKNPPHCGIGLYKLRKIIDAYPNIYLSTQYEYNTFIQKVEITP